MQSFLIKKLFPFLALSLFGVACGSHPEPGGGNSNRPSTTRPVNKKPTGNSVLDFYELAFLPPHGSDCARPGREQIFPLILTGAFTDPKDSQKTVYQTIKPGDYLPDIGVKFDPKTTLAANGIIASNTQIQPFDVFDIDHLHDSCPATCEAPYLCAPITLEGADYMSQCTQRTGFRLGKDSTKFVKVKKKQIVTLFIDAGYYMKEFFLSEDNFRTFIDNNVGRVLDKINGLANNKDIDVHLYIMNQETSLNYPFKGTAKKVKESVKDTLKKDPSQLNPSAITNNSLYFYMKEELAQIPDDTTENFFFIVTAGANNKLPTANEPYRFSEILKLLKQKKVRTYIIQATIEKDNNNITYFKNDFLAEGNKECADANECATNEECRVLKLKGGGTSTKKYCRPKLAKGVSSGAKSYAFLPVDEFAQMACETGGSFMYVRKKERLKSYLDSFVYLLEGFYEAKVHLSALPKSGKGFYQLSGGFEFPVYNSVGSTLLLPPTNITADSRLLIFVNNK